MNITGIKIRNFELGYGMPKICVPVVGKTQEEILGALRETVKESPDCIELRIDWYEKVFDTTAVIHLLSDVRAMIGDIVLLFTFRSAGEGGQRSVTTKDYEKLCREVCQSGYIDLLDVEAYMQEGLLERIVDFAHQQGVYVVGSNHDFTGTPEEEELVSRLQQIDGMGADIPKLAVMPNQERDVLNLLSATLRYHEEGGVKPVITMSMKEMGGITRLAGALVGSSLTFATVDKASAPGQLPIQLVRKVFSEIAG